MTIQKHYAYFSAAIRDGAKLRPQLFGMGHDGNRTCAYGAGIEAICGSLDTAIYQAVDPYQLFPYLRRESDCPECGDTRSDFLCAIYHLNDFHHWTREAIADWLYAEEEKLGFITLSEEGEARNEMSLGITTEDQHSPASLTESAYVENLK